MAEKSVYFWYYDGSPTKAQQVADIGATLAWLKAGGDKGIVWAPGEPTGGFARPQWDDAYLRPLTSRGVECRPWFYNWPVEGDKGAVVRALAHRWSDSIALNPETEWRVQSPHSPYNTLSKGNEYAAAWVRDLRAQLVARFGRSPLIGFSSCPSWADFPYEGFAEVCDFAHPQHYWPDALMARGENQVEAHYRRTPQEECTPILTACREYDDAGVLALAHSALLHPIAGFSAWEAGNGAFQAEAMRRAYALLPEDDTEHSETGLPPRSIQFGPHGAYLGGGFREYYEATAAAGHDAVALFGYPLRNEEQEHGLTVQYFERARFEWHPDGVKLGLVGLELLRARAA